MNNPIVSINEYNSELHEFATLFHQDFDEMPDWSKEMVLDYLVKLRSNDKRKKNLGEDLDIFLAKIKYLDSHERLGLWFKLGAHYWDIKLDMYNELERYKKLLSETKHRTTKRL